MGQVIDKLHDKRDKARQRRHKSAVKAPANWADVPAEYIVELITVVTKFGGAVRFGYSRDMGAYAIGIYGDGDPFTEYLPPSGDIREWLEGLSNDYR